MEFLKLLLHIGLILVTITDYIIADDPEFIYRLPVNAIPVDYNISLIIPSTGFSTATASTSTANSIDSATSTPESTATTAQVPPQQPQVPRHQVSQSQPSQQQQGAQRQQKASSDIGGAGDHRQVPTGHQRQPSLDVSKMTSDQRMFYSDKIPKRNTANGGSEGVSVTVRVRSSKKSKVEKVEEVQARVLPAPELRYVEGNKAKVTQGTWDIQPFNEAKHLKQKTLTIVNMSEMSNLQHAMQKFATMLIDTARKVGMAIAEPCEFDETSFRLNDLDKITQFFNENKKLKLIIVIIPNDTDVK
ncbi:uncharacterized protein [Temnothorax nylanderi]|uniref:uncharacterized protein isoform X3 n=1 Tax=Temnothorax nylanderi TaxID=102681 RepID=UPI003A8A51C5